MTETTTKPTVNSTILWWVGLIAASVLIPIVGGCGLILLSRLRRPAGSGPPLGPMLIVWMAISVLQVIALFVTSEFNFSTEIPVD